MNWIIKMFFFLVQGCSYITSSILNHQATAPKQLQQGNPGTVKLHEGPFTALLAAHGLTARRTWHSVVTRRGETADTCSSIKSDSATLPQ